MSRASTHGRVRKLKDDPDNRLGSIGITLAGAEHRMSGEDALRLANAVIYTLVDGIERSALDPRERGLSRVTP